MTKRILSIVFTLCMTLMLVPQAVFADEGTGTMPSVTAYATKDQMMGNIFAPNSDNPEVEKYGKADNYGKIVFGKNESGDPQEWYILGGDSGVKGDNTIIFAASPIATKQVFDRSDTNVTRKYDKKRDGTYEDTVNTTNNFYLLPNHYGASELRNALNDMVKEENTTYFTDTEQNLMNSTTVTTRDEYQRPLGSNIRYNYTTTDKLYALAKDDAPDSEKIIKAGTSDQTALNLDNYWEQASGKANFWVRTGDSSRDQVYYAMWTTEGPKCSIKIRDNVQRCYDVRPASNLNLSSVLFASSATAASSEIVSGTITPGTAMTLRLDGKNEKIGTVIYDQNSKKIAACKDENATGTVFLVVQGKEGDNDWYYSVPVEGTIVVTADQIEEAIKKVIPSLSTAPDLENCKIWLETTSDNATYAKIAEKKTFSVQYVDPVVVTDMNAPVGGNTFDTEASCNTPGIATTTPAITYSTTGENCDVDVTGIAD